MAKDKKEIRKRFRDATFERDGYQCRLCGAENVEFDAHHITNRKQMPHGGYVKENGITVCLPCHERVEAAWNFAEENPDVTAGSLLLHPGNLYRLVGSNRGHAEKASRRELDNED
jgi:hypothetical protein